MKKKMRVVDRVILLGAGLLASYQIAVGIDGLEALPIWCYTVSFGVLLIAGLLLIIYGYEAMDQPAVVLIATILPLSLSLGLIAEYLPGLFLPYLAFCIFGFFAILVTRFSFHIPFLNMPGRSPGIFKNGKVVLACVHGVAGLLIFLLPLHLSLTGQAGPGFALVGAGGGLVSLAGLLLFFVQTNRPVLSRNRLLSLFPLLLLLMTSAFVAGFAFG